MAQQTSNNNIKPQISFGFLIIIITIIFIGYKACNNNNSSTVETAKPEEMQTEAYVIAKIFMEKNLKAPASANFPAFDYRFYASNETYQFIIKSYVDAQNIFGAQLRTYYLIQMKWNGKDWADINNWELIDLETDQNEF